MMVGFSRRQNVDVYFVRWFCQVPVPEIAFHAYEKISTFKSWPLNALKSTLGQLLLLIFLVLRVFWGL